MFLGILILLALLQGEPASIESIEIRQPILAGEIWKTNCVKLDSWNKDINFELEPIPGTWDEDEARIQWEAQTKGMSRDEKIEAALSGKITIDVENPLEDVTMELKNISDEPYFCLSYNDQWKTPIINGVAGR